MNSIKFSEVLKYMPASIGKILRELEDIFVNTDVKSVSDNIINDSVDKRLMHQNKESMFQLKLQIEEIRLRCNAPLTIGIGGESCFITPDGGMTNYEDNAYKVSSEEVGEAFGKVCENSIYAHLDEIRRGFITLHGGHRVGICGKAVCEKERIITISEVSSLNFRIARQIIGVADGIIDEIVKGCNVTSTLIIAKPQMGKTTVLRDVIRQVSNRGFKCGVADDRGEIAAMYKGIPANNIGAQTDIIDGAPKAEAIEMLLRTMSPKVIATDEVATKEEAVAISSAFGTGVNIIATAHGEDLNEVKQRPCISELLNMGVFKQIIILKRDFSTPDGIISTEVVKL